MASGLPERAPDPNSGGSHKLLALYEYEGCPFCAKVREAMTVLDLDYLAYPTPRETLKQYGVAKLSRYRNEVKDKHGGDTLMFPFLVDANVQWQDE